MPLAEWLREEWVEGIDNYLSFNWWESLPLKLEEWHLNLSHPFIWLDIEENNFSWVRFHIVWNELSRTPIHESWKEFIENNRKLKNIKNLDLKFLKISHIKNVLDNNKKVYCLIKWEQINFYIEDENNINKIKSLTNLAIDWISL
jgi:hypothetical protein